MARAGSPQSLLRAYMCMTEHLHVHNSIAATIGQGHARPCSIPPGDAWSMALIANLTEGCIRLVEDQSVAARVLADDIEVVTGLEADVGHG